MLAPVGSPLVRPILSIGLASCFCPLRDAAHGQAAAKIVGDRALPAQTFGPRSPPCWPAQESRGSETDVVASALKRTIARVATREYTARDAEPPSGVMAM